MEGCGLLPRHGAEHEDMDAKDWWFCQDMGVREDAADWASLSPGTRISDRSDDGNATDRIDLLPSISLS